MKTLICRGATALTLLLVLPGPSLAQANDPVTPDSAAAAPADKDKVASLMGYRLTQRPVASMKEARVYAGEWITAGYLTDHIVGKIRQVGGLYIADLMTADQPKKMTNQLLIRKRDGFSILVYPGSPKPPTAEQMIGMAGLEGMSGMSGMKTIQAKPTAHGMFVSDTVRKARRVIDAWLLINGLSDLYAGATKDLGGIYISRIVDASGKEMNQAVLRKSDSYIQMINPVASIGAKKM